MLLFAALVECANVRQPALCAQLLDLEARDAEVRLDRLARWRDPIVVARMNSVDAENVSRLEALIREHGWPRASDVGMRASIAAWTIVQHADVNVQKRYIGDMTRAADKGELSWSLAATTIDRVLIREGRRQLYGTQFVLDHGKWVAEPIDDLAHVDERRAKAGLRPLADYAATMNAAYPGVVSGLHPASPAKAGSPH